MPEAKTTTTRSTRHQRYLSYFKWLVIDMARSQWRRGVLASILSFTGKALQPAAIGLGILYASALKTGEPINILRWTFNTRTETSPNMPLLITIALTVMAAYAISALCLYRSRIFALRIRVEYSAHCTRHLLHLAETNTFDSRNTSLAQSLVGLSTSNTVYCGRVAYFFVLAAPEFMILLVAYVTLFLLEPMLTIELSLVSVVACFFLYKTNVRASAASTKSKRFKKPAKAALRNEIASRLDGTSSKEKFENPAWRRWLENTVNPIRSVEDGALIFGLASAALLALIIIGLVAQIESEWTRVVTYLIGFAVVATQLRNLSRRCVCINRFYPQAREYWNAVVNHSISVDKMAGSDNEDEDEE